MYYIFINLASLEYHVINAEEEEERQKLEAQKREEERLALMRMAESERQEYLRMF